QHSRIQPSHYTHVTRAYTANPHSRFTRPNSRHSKYSNKKPKTKTRDPKPGTQDSRLKTRTQDSDSRLMKIATWNVNSIRTRLPRLISWLRRVEPDVVCLQETKVIDENFPAAELEEIGYKSLTHGQKTYNAVAILSRPEMTDPIRNSPGDQPDSERRLLSATVAGIRVVDVYAPNGGFVGSERYGYKLEWFRRLRSHLDSSFGPELPLLLCGDFNVAPQDR